MSLVRILAQDGHTSSVSIHHSQKFCDRFSLSILDEAPTLQLAVDVEDRHDRIFWIWALN